MYRNARLAAIIPAHNEDRKIGHVVARVHDADVGVDDIIVVDDASTDRTAIVAAEQDAHVVHLTQRSGVGHAIRTGYRTAIDRGADILITIAGNNKDEPREIPRLVNPILDEGYDFVIGSRHLQGGHAGGDMPGYRQWATRLHPWALSCICGKRLTESTNGFRAVTRRLIEDPRIDLEQRWLDAYGMEVYLLYKAITLGYGHHEVPCTKVYPPKRIGYTKMTPVLGWWNILRPIVFLGLGIRK